MLIPCGRAAELLERQLESLARQRYTGDWEVVLGDNSYGGAVRATASRLRERFPELRVAEAAAGNGPSYARNVAARGARGDLLAFCDADDEVDANWLTNLVHAATQYDLVGGAVDETALNNAQTGAVRAPMGIREEPLVLLDFLPFAVGANCAVWANVFEAIGGWNESYPRANDVEFSWRAQVRGYRLGFAADAVVCYRHRTSHRELRKQFYGWGRADAQLYHDFREFGLTRRNDAALWRTWARLLKRVYVLRTPSEARGQWLVDVARALGRLGGSIRWRVYFP